jgi:ABC-2 type transport system permease protein
MKALLAQTRSELVLSLRNGEQLLVNVAIPLLLLVFFSAVEVLPIPTGVDKRVDFLAPGIIALAVMSNAMVALAIGTGFERHYKVLKRLGSTPLGRGRWVLAKIGMVKILLILQIALIVIAAFLLGWNPGGTPLLAIPAVVLGAFAFGGIGLLMAGTLRGTVTLALANGLYLVLLLLGGMIIPFSEMPGFFGTIGKVLPSGALSEVLQSCLRSGAEPAGSAWAVLGVWAVLAPLAAVKFFRWE